MSSAELEHAVILASAGSGKTWQLSTRFLRLIALGADPTTILASTFTRAAAGEIRDRVLERLASAALDEDERAHLARALGMPPASLDVDEIVRRVVVAWPRLQIRTLDSLMAAIVAAEGFELAIEPSTALADEAQSAALREEATRRMLERIDAERAVALLKELTAGRSDSNVGRAIGAVVDGLGALWREAPSHAWDAVPASPRSDASAIAEAAARLRAAAPRIGHRKAESFILAVAECAESERWEALLASGFSAKILAGETSYYNKPIPDDALVAAHALAAHAVSMVREGIRRQTLAARDLVACWSESLDELKRERRLMAFDDLPWLLRRAETTGSIERVAYRLDGRIHHMLLDEMQDTSAAQWAALRPFAEEIYSQRAGERSFFCVGDLKQSIYGWRGATPEILAALPEVIGVEATALAQTRRCGPTVVAAVNRVFTNLGDRRSFVDAPGAARRFAGFFVSHETTRGEVGRVELVHAPAAGDDGDESSGPDSPGDGSPGQAALRLRAAADRVAALHRAAPRATIGVLVRTNEVVNRMLFLLGPGGHGLPAAGRGGAPLTDAPPVEAILDLVRLAIHPGHTVAAFNVAHSPLGALVGLVAAEPDPDAATNGSSGAVPGGAARSRVARRVRERVLRDGLTATVGAWVAALAPHASARERRRLVQLAELVARGQWRGGTGATETSMLDEFVQLVETTKIADEAEAPIQVMTVHQSKGLEFDLVVLPELEARHMGRPPVAAWDRASPGGPPTAIIRWVEKERRRALPPECAEVFAHHGDRLALESICLLYVALTRARDGLYMIVDPPRKGRSDKTAAGLLREALAPGAAAEATTLFAEGDERAMLARLAARADDGAPPGPAATAPRKDEAPHRPRRPEPAPAPRRGPIVLLPSRGPMRLASPSPSAATLDARPELDRCGVLRGDVARRRDAIDRGTALHAMLERVEWLESFADDDATLAIVARRAAPTRDAAWAGAQVSSFRQLLRRDLLATLLSRGARSGATFEVRREHRFARATSEGLQLGAIDRLVLTHDGDRVAAAEIVDFKTGGANDEEPGVASMESTAIAGTLARGYGPQIAAYRAAVAEQFGLDLAAVAATLAFLDLDRAVIAWPAARDAERPATTPPGR
ncbi:MAG: UvrD-helicase domain-containing protein [Phycisphaerales bacterium]